MCNFSKINFNQVSLFINKWHKPLLTLYSTILLGFIIFGLNKGMFWGDEAWHQLHLEGNTPSASISQWYKIFSFLNLNNLVLNRYLIFTLNITSSIIYCIGIGKYLKVKDNTSLIIIGLISAFIFKLPIQISPCWDYYNIILVNIIIGLFMFSLSLNKIFWKYLIILVVGFLITIVPFIKITSIILPLFLIILLFIYFNKNVHKTGVLTSFFVGIILSITVIFIFIPIDDIFSSFRIATIFLKYDTNHGLLQIIKWSFNLLSFYVIDLIPFAILLWLIIKNYHLCKMYQYLFGFVLSVILLEFSRSLINNPISFTPIKSIYIICTALLFEYISLKNYKKILVTFIALIIPIFLIIGSDHQFQKIASVFATPLIATLLILVGHSNSRIYNIIVHLIIITSIGFLILISFSTQNIAGYTLLEQKIKLNSIDSKHLLIDTVRYNRMREIDVIIPKNSSVLVDNPNLWGYVFLLNYKPVVLYFRYNKDAFIEYLSLSNKNPQQFYLITDRITNFQPDNYNINGYSTIISNTEHFTIYNYTIK